MIGEKTVTIYIHDLDISDKSKNFLLHADIIKLDDLLDCDMSKLSATYNVSDDVLRELNSVIDNRDDIISSFEERAKRINEMLPNVQNIPIDSLDLSARAMNALKRKGIFTVGALIQMSRKDIFALYNVGAVSKEEITNTIETIIQSGNAIYYKPEEICETDKESTPENNRISEVLSEIEGIGIENIPFSVRASNALKRAKINSAAELVQMSENGIMSLRNVGLQTKDEIVSVIDAIVKEGKAYFDDLAAHYVQDTENKPIEMADGKGFDFSLIDVLKERFDFKPAKMAKWFGLSKMSIYNALDKRLPRSRSVWTGKELSEIEHSILIRLIESKNFEYTDDEVICYCMNDKQDDFVCLFIYENEIKCFFLNDLPNEIREQIVSNKMHIYTESEYYCLN